VLVIGIDCATKESNIGLAHGSVQDDRVLVTKIAVGESKVSAETIMDWLSCGQPTLLAFDSPLGWPVKLSSQLIDHVAGQLLLSDPDILFSRETDRVVHDVLHKKPLEVGANYIARTAHSALRLLNDLRQKTGLRIPLAWEMGTIEETCAIEVYPGGTLRARNIEAVKKDDELASKRRTELLRLLRIGIHPERNRKTIIENPDAFDAVMCILAASDFLLGKCITIPAAKMKLVRKEGWIWVRKPVPSI